VKSWQKGAVIGGIMNNKKINLHLIMLFVSYGYLSLGSWFTRGQIKLLPDFETITAIKYGALYGSFFFAYIVFFLSIVNIIGKRKKNEFVTSLTLGVIWVVTSGYIIFVTGLGAMAQSRPAPAPSLLEIIFSLPLYGAGLIHVPVFPEAFLIVNSLVVGFIIPYLVFIFMDWNRKVRK
jgi:hypothetical protein